MGRKTGAALVLLLLSSMVLLAESSGKAPVLSAVPAEMQWRNLPADWKVDGKGETLTIAAGPSTDHFIPPTGGSGKMNSPLLLFTPAAEFSLSAKVTVDFQSPWDAGVLVVWLDETTWAKLCFERSRDGKPMIVTVVTRGLSDDSNSIAIEGNAVYLKVAKTGQAILFYASEDGKKWKSIRAFSFAPKEQKNLKAGFSSQSPTGQRCSTEFSEIRYSPKPVNLWTGE